MEFVDPSEHGVEVVEHMWIPLADGQRLAARIWLPKGAREKPVPALFEYLPYRKRDLTRLRDDLTHGWFASQGYACVRVDMRGSGEADGVITDQYREQELADGEAAIAWIAEQSWCSGAVGMTERSLVHDPEEARATLRWLRDELDIGEALVQQYLPGAEYTVGCLGNAAEPGEDTDFQVLPPLEVNFGALDPDLPRILTHASKAEPDSPYWTDVTFERADVAEDAMAIIRESCRRMCLGLGLRDYARIDFRCDVEGVPHLLDANVNPTWVKGGKLATMAEWVGLDYSQLLRTILEAAQRRTAAAAG